MLIQIINPLYLIQNANYDHTASLTISALESSDEGTEFILTVTNLVGGSSQSMNYTVT